MAENSSKRFYFKSPRSYEPNLLRKRFFERELEVKVIKNGIVLPVRRNDVNDKKEGFKGGVCDENFNFVAGYTRQDPYVHNKARKDYDVNDSYVVDREELTYLDEDVIFGGTLMGHFGHFILESLSRIWYALQASHTDSLSNAKILFVPASHGGYRKWFDDFFRLMGISKERIVYVKQPMQCRSITVPEQSMYTGVSFTKEYLIPYETIKSNVTPGNIKKIYLSRKDYESNLKSGGKNHNEQYFEDFFVTHGFQSVEMEKLSIEEQISIILGADEIAAGTGTLTHFAFFCKPTAKFIMLSRLNSYYGWQPMINQVTNVDAYVIDCSRNFLYDGHGAGCTLFAANKYWKEFVSDYFNETIDDSDDCLYFDGALDKYVSDWFQRFGAREDICIDSLKKLCNRVIMLENEIDKQRPILTYRTYISNKGWCDWKSENQLSNPFDKNFEIQAIKIDFSNPFCNLYYSVYYNEKEGWFKEVTNSQTAGKNKSIFGMKIRLDDKGNEKYDIWYRVHTFEGKWTSWAKNGEEIISPNVKLNSLQIKLENKRRFLFEQIKPGTFTIAK